MSKGENISQEIVIYEDKNGEVKIQAEVRSESVWLTLNQIAQLFYTHKSGISRHLSNIFKSGELSKSSTVAKIATVQTEGNRQVERLVEYFNLDAILSVGYRVNSKRATQFRIWATGILRKHILEGYSLNQKRLLELRGKQLNEFEQAVNLVRKTIDSRVLSGSEADGILRVISDYANTWVLLQKYDEEKLEPAGKFTKVKKVLTYDEALSLVNDLKNNLLKKKEAGDLFGRERGESLASILGSVSQSFAGKDLYPSVEEKAAHLLYFVIKDHPFSDGNKRLASFLFVVFLAWNKSLLKKNGEKKINDNALVAIALLIAESEPKQKEVMVKLVLNFLVN
ncbi:MAG TPA: virulence protein RhuM/Fic/DOC family protein [Patescibacteria group bacterium]|nr:virulence protein RhuM/Fic/DOC family protein [Patescibacteria group bacterium]